MFCDGGTTVSCGCWRAVGVHRLEPTGAQQSRKHAGAILVDPLRDPPHIVLAHSARGASWRTKAQSTWAQGWARVVRDDLLVRRNANAVERFFRHLPV